MSTLRLSRHWGWGVGVLVLVMILVAAFWDNAAAAYDSPSFAIVAVNKDADVTIQGQGFPPNTDFVVTIGAMGTRGVGGSWAALLNTGAGSFTAVIPIPAGWRGASQLAIRLENYWSGHFAFNWFYNNTATLPVASPPPVVVITPVVTAFPTAVPATAVPATPVPPTPTAAPPPATAVPNPNTGYTGFPTCSIQAVVKDTSVTIVGNNFPKQMTFTVRMGLRGTQANPSAGTIAATFNTRDANTFTQTFPIPITSVGKAQIGLRVESSAAANSYNCYNWFYNNSTP